MHKDSKRERRLKYFLKWTIWLILLFGIYTPLLFIPLVLEGFMRIEWALIIAGYFLFLIILDFIWFSAIINPIHIRWRRPRNFWKSHERLEHIDEIENLRKRRVVRDILAKRFSLILLTLLGLLLFAGWNISVAYNVGGVIFVVVMTSVMIAILIFEYFHFLKPGNIIRKRRMKKKKRELRKFKAHHH